jgi:hypothetical protein
MAGQQPLIIWLNVVLMILTFTALCARVGRRIFVVRIFSGHDGKLPLEPFRFRDLTGCSTTRHSNRMSVWSRSELRLNSPLGGCIRLLHLSDGRHHVRPRTTSEGYRSIWPTHTA